MLKRFRDLKKEFKPQGQISYEEWKGISDRFIVAKKFLSPTNPLYLLMQEDLKKGEDIILENRIREVHDITQVTDTLKKVFITKRKIQIDELVGQIKYLRDFFKELNEWISLKEQLEKEEADGRITIQRDER